MTGSDLTDKAVEMLNKNFSGNDFFQLDIGTPLTKTLLERKFDIVTAFDMLFHIVDDACYSQALLNFSSLVKPGGTLIFSDNLSPSKEIRLEHQVSRSEGDVYTLMQENGFTLKKVIPMFVFMNDPVRSSSRIMRKLFSFTYRFVRKGELYGGLVGGILYPLEIFLIRLLERVPSTEIFVWERIDDAGVG